LLQFFVGVAEPARFQRSPGSVSLRIEEQHHIVAAEILEANGFPVFIRKAEIRCFAFNFHDYTPCL